MGKIIKNGEINLYSKKEFKEKRKILVRMNAKSKQRNYMFH